MAIGTLYRLSSVARTSGTLHVNTWWFRQRVDTPGQTPNTVLINDWQTIMQDVYRGCFPSFWQHEQYNVFVDKGSPENLSISVAFNGRESAMGSPAPTQLSAVCTWLTGIAGRRFRGRTYFGSMGTGAFNGQVLGASHRSALDIFCFRLVNNFSAQSAFDFVVYSDANKTSNPVTGYTLRNEVYTQRRRTAAYGE